MLSSQMRMLKLASTLTVSFTFDEDMDVTRDPSVVFDKDVASTLIEGTPQGAWGRWQDLQGCGGCC